MTTEEFSNEFDVLVLSYSSNILGQQTSIAFDEYEKSVFLTKALEQIIISLYNGKNSSLDFFEKTEEIRRYLSNLVNTALFTEPTLVENTALSEYSTFFSIPDYVWFITYELAVLSDSNSDCLKGKTILVLPITQDDYYRILLNPFRLSNSRRALRLDIKDDTIEIISKYPISSYLIRYIKKPSPIILLDLEDLKINGESIKTDCELNPAIHRLILEEAVRMAIASKVPNAGNNNQTK